jgi:DNA polymerase eta
MALAVLIFLTPIFQVVAILSTKGKCERASIDEVYLDLTDAAKEMLLESPPELAESIFEEATKSNILDLPSVRFFFPFS